MGMLSIEREVFLRAEQELGTVKAFLATKSYDALKLLLEERFLYQNVKISEDECCHLYDKYLTSNSFSEYFKNQVSKFRNSSLGFGFKGEQGNNCIVSHQVFPPDTVNTTCELCREVTPHNPQTYDVLGGAQTKRGYDETIVLQMQCQKCKTGHLIALIRRIGLGFQLVGRNQVDSYVPDFDISYIENYEAVQDYFVQAMMAERTGSHLAAICLLRVAIEQYMRAVIGGNELRLTGDELYDKFDVLLPADFPRDRVTNLKVIYARLSEIMHNPSSYVEGEFVELYGKIKLYFSFAKLMPPVS